MTSVQVLELLEKSSDPMRAENAAWFFKTGEGQYGYGDQFLGLSVPQTRAVAKLAKDLSIQEVALLLQSNWHEARLCAVLIWVYQFSRSDDAGKERIYNAYLKNKSRVNNWDLVDSSAHKIVGAWTYDKSKDIIFTLAHSSSLWDRRIAILSCFYGIGRGDPKLALQIAPLLLNDREDLIHKAVGWMLREIGKRCSREALETFLDEYYDQLPRTTLRYAIEHFSKEERATYLKGAHRSK